ncbi:DUF5412 family protein [Cohnella thailandensis]|uniref:Uncharacterized protein n=1 Tax=Cohnella thailandensis TaxID=557557 RepID=A0A841SZ19_9BACL|nr:DUF5412 family protein [Cohnella thailandensis]MBB6635080.1 hypothetical protein [Cohnella thailandensis]MBP1977857.1 hypothetical protein [Cohnella thailandensis]
MLQKNKVNAWAFVLMIVCAAASVNSLFATLGNYWQLAPPAAVLFLASAVALILGMIGIGGTGKFAKTRSWLTIAVSLPLMLALAAILLLQAIFGEDREPFRTVHSPDDRYSIKFYRWDEGATGTFGVRGELQGPLWFKKKIYVEKRTEEIEVEWAGEHALSINGHQLDLDKEETYGY